MDHEHNRKRKHDTMSETEHISNKQITDLQELNPVKAHPSAPVKKQCSQFRKKNTRKGRIIVRNLSYKTTENKLREHFEQFGPITEINLLKRPDGRLVGCGFVQFEVVQHAAKALCHLSGKQFLGRDIVCDWALGKDTYVKNMQDALNKEIKQEGETLLGTVEIKDEPNDEDIKDIDTLFIKTEISTDEIKSEDSNSDENSDSENSTEDESTDEKDNLHNEPEIKKPKVMSNDVNEGKTVFIRNVPFSATNDDIKNCMSQFGPIVYSLVCIDPLTEYSKGSAFVKFVNVEDAEKCLEAGTELTLMGNILDCSKAVSKGDLEKKKSNTEVNRDSRHLYLIKEGVILAGTKAAQGVSPSDMAKRLEIERWKTQILRNLNMFVSLYRLIIHNLPPTYDDKQLRQLFAKYAGPTAVIKEARVMRDLKRFDNDGKPVSKDHGFVSFTKHEDALRALRAINNNPNIFTNVKRPIVAFSIENKSVMNARNKRLIKSRINNPNCKEYDPNVKQTEQKTTNSKHADGTEIPSNEFSGIAAKPGVNKIRSKHKLATQAQLHYQNVKQEKKRLKLTRKSIKKRKQDYIKQAKQQKGKKKPKGDQFTKIVDNYTKSNRKVKQNTKKQKWYESK